MRMIDRSFYFVLKVATVLLLSVGCKGNVEKEESETFEGVYTIKLNKDISEYSEISKFEIQDIIQLETNAESLLGKISKVQQIEEQWYIHSMSKLFVFNTNGDFTYTIGEIGNGPGELSEVTDFWFDSGQKQIIVLDNSGRKIVIFNLTGEFQKEIGINSHPQGIAKSNNEFLQFLNRSVSDFESNDSYDVALLDENGVVKRTFFPSTPEYTTWYMPNIIFYEFDGKVNYFDYWRNQIYTWNEEEFIPYLKIDFADSNFPYEFTKSAQDYDKKKRNYRFIHMGLVESENYLYFDIYDKGELAYFFYDKQNNELNFLNKDRYNPENLFIQPIATLSNDRFVSTIEPEHIKVLREHNRLTNPVLIDLADAMDKYDNPSLLVFTVNFAD
ncbi:6-bladed beta-propeller [Algoriphagus sp.]|uniref:6-bladed beta-propeller n=1 Tax=Algoriphagus sp. TaxID=1872435 RepID=UPI003F6E6120